MKSLLTILIAAFIALSCPFAQDATVSGNDSLNPRKNLRTKNEACYFYFGLGWANITYPRDMQDLMGIFEDLPGASRVSVEMDILGLYFPVNNHQTAVGLIVNGAADQINAGDEWMQISQYTYGASVMQFVSNNIGDGFFLRSDLGFAAMGISSSANDSAEMDLGFGFLAGVGYAIPFTGTRILFNLNFSYHNIKDDEVSKMGISGGLLF